MYGQSFIDLASVDWRQDRITRDYVERNREKLSAPEQMSPRELGDAVTYCRSAWNPFSEELMRRSGHLEAFREATTDRERAEVLKSSCRYHGFMLY